MALIDETWSSEAGTVCREPDAMPIGWFNDLHVDEPHLNVQRAALAAQAPAMARILKRHHDEVLHQGTPGIRCDECDIMFEHLPDCPLVAVLRAAEVIE